MVYIYVFRFPRIRFGSKVEVSISEPHRNGNWLQRNPHHNPQLSVLLQDRAGVLWTQHLCLWWSGGPGSVSHRGRTAERHPRAQCAGELIVCIRTVPTFCLAQEGSTDTDRPNIWNDKTHYAHFLKTFNTDRHSRIWPKRT